MEYKRGHTLREKIGKGGIKSGMFYCRKENFQRGIQLGMLEQNLEWKGIKFGMGGILEWEGIWRLEEKFILKKNFVSVVN